MYQCNVAPALQERHLAPQEEAAEEQGINPSGVSASATSTTTDQRLRAMLRSAEGMWVAFDTSGIQQTVRAVLDGWMSMDRRMLARMVAMVSITHLLRMLNCGTQYRFEITHTEGDGEDCASGTEVKTTLWGRELNRAIFPDYHDGTVPNDKTSCIDEYVAIVPSADASGEPISGPVGNGL